MRRGVAATTWAALLVGAGAASAQGAPPAQRSLFPEGQCGGLLCETVGGPQAPSAQRAATQRSLFPEGECGGLLCEAVGGEQAPKRTEPPPPCGGGLLCAFAPYKMGVPLTASDAARIEAERQAASTRAVPAPNPPVTHRNRAKARSKVASDAGPQRP